MGDPNFGIVLGISWVWLGYAIVMSLITRNDFDSRIGQEKIIKTIHKLEAKMHELEIELHQLQKKEEMVEHEFQGPEAY